MAESESGNPKTCSFESATRKEFKKIAKRQAKNLGINQDEETQATLELTKV